MIARVLRKIRLNEVLLAGISSPEPAQIRLPKRKGMGVSSPNALRSHFDVPMDDERAVALAKDFPLGSRSKKPLANGLGITHDRSAAIIDRKSTRLNSSH